MRGIFILALCLGLKAGAIAVLDDAFFESMEGSLRTAPVGTYGCSTVSGPTAQGESARLGRKMRRYCGGNVTLKFIRKRANFVPFTLSTTVQYSGYYLLCCRRKEIKALGRRR